MSSYEEVFEEDLNIPEIKSMKTFKFLMENNLGKEEYSIIEKTVELIRAGFPALKAEIPNWLSKVLNAKEDLSSLISSLEFHKNSIFISMSDFYIRSFPLPEIEDLRYSSKEERISAVLYFNKEYRLLKREYDFIQSLLSYLENLLWILNTMIERGGKEAW